jgi:hypothetical protein
MRFAQASFFSSQELSLEAQGLYVCHKNGRGHKTMEFLYPYEELLPLRLNRHRSLPFQTLGSLIFGLAIVARWLWLDLAPGRGVSTIDAMLLITGVLLVLSLLLHYGVNNWWYHVTLSAPNLNLTLADRNSQESSLEAFSEALEARTKAYLRREYGGVNPLGMIEPQLRRVAWLQELEVLSSSEALALATRLTGRISSQPLVSMGQMLEAPYVN